MPCVSTGRVGERHPSVFCFFFLFFIFSCSTTKKGWEEGIIPFTTCSVQGQASSEGGEEKNNAFPFPENHFSGVFPSFPAASPQDGTGMLRTKVGKPRGDPSRAQGVGGGCRANIIRAER